MASSVVGRTVLDRRRRSLQVAGARATATRRALNGRHVRHRDDPSIHERLRPATSADHFSSRAFVNRHWRKQWQGRMRAL